MPTSSTSLKSNLEIERFARIALDVHSWLGHEQFFGKFDTITNGKRTIRWADMLYTVNRGSEAYYDPHTSVHENAVCEFVGIKHNIGNSFQAHMDIGEFVIACFTELADDDLQVEVDGQALQCVTFTIPLDRLEEVETRIVNRMEKISKLKFDIAPE